MWKSPRVKAYQEGEADEARQLELDPVEEVRINALTQSARYLQGVRCYHDRNVQQSPFDIGDLVLRRIQDETGLHKLNSRWEGPFIVSKVTRPGSYRITDADGNEALNSGTSSTCADFILDPSNTVMSVDLFNKARVSISFLTTLKAVFSLAASSLTTLQKFFQPG